MNSGNGGVVRKRGRKRDRLETKTRDPWIVEDVGDGETLRDRHSDANGGPSSYSNELSRSASTSPVRKLRRDIDSCSSGELLQLLKLIREQGEQKPNKLGNNHLNNVVPEFDPASKSQSIDSWLRKVNECALIYEWDERQTIHFSLQKLTGLAKKWFEALPSVVYGWTEWQAKLRKAFPSEQNYGRLLEEMLARTSRYNESLREYFYDKLTLLNRCNISGKKAVDCIVHGLIDKSIRNGAQALNCEEPEDLLNFLNSQGSSDNSGTHKKRFESNPSRVQNAGTSGSVTGSTENGTTCFNCRARGHPYYKCSKPIIRCQKCRRVGHDLESCKLTPLTTRGENKPASVDERKALVISTQENSNDKFFKKAEVDGRQFLAYVDFGSDSCLMRESDASLLSPSKCFSNLPTVKGFGNNSVTPVYKTMVTLKVDEVEAQVEVLVVGDEFLSTPLLVGQNFTELPSVTVLKDHNRLFFYKNPYDDLYRQSDSLKLSVINDSNVDKIDLVEVSASNPKFSGDVYLDGYTSSEPGKEYHLHEGAYRIENGQGHVVITNLATKPLALNSGLPIARAMPFLEHEVRLVNKISTEVSPIELSDIKVGKSVEPAAVERLHKLLQSYRDCFAMSLEEIGCFTEAEMKIDLVDDKPIVYRPYRLSYSEREQVRGIVDELLQNDIIQESNSSYSSPILLVKKKSGEQRLCVDFRALNNKTRKDCFPLPLIDDQLANLSGNTLFTTLDLASGYYQIPMAEDSRHLTAFVTPDGHYEFKRMPFGLANAPAVFQRIINNMLGARRFESALAYLDDILVPSVGLEQGFERLEAVLKLLRENGLTLKLSKCRFFENTLNYLGYEISAEGVRPNENKVLAVKDFPIPKNVHEVRQFLGLAGYFRKFIRGFGEIARPLTSLLKKDSSFRWTEVEMEAYTILKDKLVERPILALYNPKLDTELHTDASALGVSGILLQWQENPRTLKPVAYFSRQTTPEEHHLHSYELETLAIVCSLRKFRVYLLGLRFKVVTDCHALRTTLTKRDLIPRIARWWLQISEFTFDIEYRPGARMSHVDALSRNTTLTSGQLDESTITVYHITQDDWLLTLQMSDPDVSRIVKILKPENDEEIKDIRKNFALKNNRVYRKVDDKLCLVVPRSARFQICRSSHDDIGHLGEAKTIEKIKSQFWFPRMRRFIQKYIRNCIECAYTKDNNKNSKSGHLYPIEKVSIPFHTVHIDHLGPFTKSKKGNAYILTIVDGYTKYLFVKAVKDTKTSSTIKVLESIFYDFGLPARIISDRGTSFTSASFKSFCSSHGIKHVLNAVACPRANGQAERFNQTILNALAKCNSGKDERNWDMWLGRVQWGINNTINATTQRTASEVLFGVKLRDSLTNKLESLDTSTVQSTESIVKIRDEVSSNIKNKQDKQKRQYDAERTPATVYKEGDLIKITRTNYYNQGNSSKLLSKFIGPFKIVQSLGNDRYKIAGIPGFSTNKRSFESVVAADRIRPWININHANIRNSIDNNIHSDLNTSSDDDDDNLPLSVLQQQKQKNA